MKIRHGKLNNTEWSKLKSGIGKSVIVRANVVKMQYEQGSLMKKRTSNKWQKRLEALSKAPSRFAC